MGKIRKEKLGDKANEYNFFDVTYQNNGLMQPIQQEEKTTRSGKIFSPEKLIQRREENKQENLKYGFFRSYFFKNEPLIS